jgi:hypothetical protein
MSDATNGEPYFISIFTMYFITLFLYYAPLKLGMLIIKNSKVNDNLLPQ